MAARKQYPLFDPLVTERPTLARDGNPVIRDAPQVALVVEVNERGKRRAVDPTIGSAANAEAIGPLVPPDFLMTLGWARSSGSAGPIEDWSAPGSQRLIVRLGPDEDGLRLDVARS